MPPTVLLIDNDEPLVAALTVTLADEGYDVISTRDPLRAQQLLGALRPDLIVLNPALADGERLGLLIELRRLSTAVVIMLVGLGDEDARVQGLAFGADDYVSRPASARELTARIRAHLRHQDSAMRAGLAIPSYLQVGSLTLDAATHTATNDGEPLHLTVMEFRLLQHLMAHANVVVTQGALLQQVWGYQDVSVTDVVRTTIYRLRQKLRDDPTQPRLLYTVAGVGFILRAASEESDAQDEKPLLT